MLPPHNGELALAVKAARNGVNANEDGGRSAELLVRCNRCGRVRFGGGRLSVVVHKER